MKKIPTLFEREFENHRIVRILPNISPDLAWVMAGDGVATIKWDGACCAVINGVFYKRYDAKHGKPVPPNAIKCQENADPVTGHLPCWVPCDRTATGDKWFWDAYDRMGIVPDGTYETIGPHFRANPYNLDADVLKPHGKDIVILDRSFEGIRTYLETHVIEGIVFWKDGHPRCKIKGRKYECERDFAVWMRFDSFPVLEDCTVIFGHTPTIRFQYDNPMAIWDAKSWIGIDCGCMLPEKGDPWSGALGRLSCLRLDDMQVFYSEEPQYDNLKESEEQHYG